MQQLFPARIAADRAAWLDLLQREGIRGEANLDAVYGIYDDGGALIATGARYRNILKCIAICRAHQGGTLFNELMSGLMADVFTRGYGACYVYTKADACAAFRHLGFRDIAHVDDTLYFLENAVRGLPHYLQALRAHYVAGSRIAAIVMNANPFTNGHRYLVEKAARDNDVVHLFVLSEDLSQFPGAVRLALVQAGTADLANVHVHPTGDYIISAATFPAYFLREDANITEIQARLDARIFKEHIAPALGITRRYVGSEPLSPATAIYNAALQREFAGDPELVIIARREADGGVISASRVRRLLAAGNLEAIRPLVPPTTFHYLQSGELP